MVLFPLLLSFLTGFVAFLTAPLIGRAIYGGEHNPTTDTYFAMAASLFGRALLVLRETGSLTFELHSSSPGEFGYEHVTLDGEAKHFEDRGDNLTRWYGKPFGIADEERGVIVNPRLAETAEKALELKEEGISIEKDGTRFTGGVTAIRQGADRLVNMNAARAVASGSATAALADQIKEYTILSQSLFDKHPTMQYMVWLMALGMGWGMMFLAWQVIQTTGGGGGSISVGVPTLFPGWWL